MSYDYVAWEEAGQWAAHCPAVAGVYGIGQTSAAAIKDLKEALEELDSYLEEIGQALPVAGKFRTGELRL
jgi:predicted RNase H-like HicB family nuclease